ncbi:MAG: tetrahydromethanopterin S-methyltransferase subunit H [Methanophagales archaeon]|nr:tetrahydromethanopterin S-methyltransferase subunit H [Methanophagales archaeon]PXF52691.1 MAG: tetrahydromethanopterin S-methyltransferase subunit H [Methanophagales archaeon]
MFVFDRKQDIYEIAGVKVGGQPGETATVLAGTIFYAKHDIVEDADKGIFDKKKAEEAINKQDEMADITGNPAIIQIFSESEEAMKKEIEFCAEVSDAPFLIDSTVAEAKMAGAKYCDEVGLADRAVYNSINMSITDEEYEVIKNAKLESAILLAFNPKDVTVAGRADLLETGAGTIKIGGVEKGILQIGKECGITKPIIDPATLPIGAGAGSTCACALVFKSRYGIPCGLGIHNAPSAWTWIKKYRKEHSEHPKKGVWIGPGAEAFKMCDIGSNVIPALLANDLIMYGPIEHAPTVFPLIGMIDMIVGEAAQVEHEIQLQEPHPYLKMSG